MLYGRVSVGHSPRDTFYHRAFLPIAHVSHGYRFPGKQRTETERTVSLHAPFVHLSYNAPVQWPSLQENIRSDKNNKNIFFINLNDKIPDESSPRMKMQTRRTDGRVETVELEALNFSRAASVNLFYLRKVFSRITIIPESQMTARALLEKIVNCKFNVPKWELLCST